MIFFMSTLFLVFKWLSGVKQSEGFRTFTKNYWVTLSHDSYSLHCDNDLGIWSHDYSSDMFNLSRLETMWLMISQAGLERD